MEYIIPDVFFGFVCLIGLFGLFLFVCWVGIGFDICVCVYVSVAFFRSKSLLYQSYMACENLIVIGQK